MRLKLSALVVAAGLAGLSVTAQAAPTSAPAGVATTSTVQVAYGERRMMRHRMMKHRMMKHRMMRHRMMKRHM